jgi:hypothetical protein
LGTAVSRGTKGVRERWREGGREGGRGGGDDPLQSPTRGTPATHLGLS